MEYTCHISIESDTPTTLLRMGPLTLSWTPQHLECRMGEHTARLPSKHQFSMRVISGPTLVCFVDDVRADLGVMLPTVLPMTLGPVEDHARVRINGLIYARN